MSSTTVFVVPQGAPENVLKPSLMPFHVAYSGSAPISTYFLKRPLPPPGKSGVAEDTTYLIDNKFILRNVHNFHKRDENEQSADDIKTDDAQDASNANQEAPTSEKVHPARYQAAFRGRVVVGQEFPLPEGYTGVVLHRDDSTRQSIVHAPPPKPVRRARKKEEAPAEASKRPTRLVGAQRANALKAKAAAKAKAKQQRVPTKFNPDGEEDELIDDDDDLPGAPAVLAALTVQEPKAEPKQEEEIKQEEEEETHMEVEEPPPAEEKLEDQVDKLEVTGTFREFVVWSADAPVDEGRDEYLRAIHEWVNIASEVDVVTMCFCAPALIRFLPRSTVSDCREHVEPFPPGHRQQHNLSFVSRLQFCLQSPGGLLQACVDLCLVLYVYSFFHLPQYNTPQLKRPI
jgi:Ribonuclease H2 non-catalytic subunit (Ylr154p-like)